MPVTSETVSVSMMISCGVGSEYTTSIGGGAYVGGGGSASAGVSSSEASIGAGASSERWLNCMRTSAIATMKCRPTVIAMNAARPLRKLRRSRGAFSSRRNVLDRVTTVNLGIRHLVDDLDGHSGY